MFARRSSSGDGERRAVAAALLVAALAVATMPLGCDGRGGGGGVIATVPEPDLVGSEPSVAERVCEAAARVRATRRSAEAWGTFGMVLEAHGFDDLAATCYGQASDLDRRQVRWTYLAARVLMNVDPARAVPYFERAIELDPGTALIPQVFGDALLRVGREEDAARQYRLALERDPAARRAQLGLGEIALRRDDLDEALARFNAAADLDYFDREVHAKLARVHRRRGDDDAAATESLLVRAYPGLSPMADPYAAAVAAEAVSVKALTERGLAAVRAGRLEEAERVFWLALKARPENVRNRVNLAGVLVRLQRIEEAVELLQAALAAEPDNPDVHNTWAVALLETNRIDAAAQHLRQAIAADPGHDEALVNLGRVLEAQGQAARAAEAYAQALVIDPVSVPAHERLAALLDRQGRSVEALPHWRAAAEYGRFRPDRSVRFAVAASQQGRFGEAASALRRGLRETPDDVPMMAAIVTILATCPDAAHRDGAEALVWARRLVGRTGGRHIESLELLAAAHAEHGDFASARATGERALALARAEGSAALAARIESHLALYRSKRPYHQPRATGVGPAPPPDPN